jgi:signal transduction histidine kinase
MDVSRITLGKIDLQKECVDLGKVVRDAYDASNWKLSNARHEVTVSLPMRSILVDGDPVRLGQVFTNILVNAKNTRRQAEPSTCP